MVVIGLSTCWSIKLLFITEMFGINVIGIFVNLFVNILSKHVQKRRVQAYTGCGSGYVVKCINKGCGLYNFFYNI